MTGRTDPAGPRAINVSRIGKLGRDGIKGRIDRLEAVGILSLVEGSDPLPLMPVSEPDIIHEVRVYRTNLSAI